MNYFEQKQRRQLSDLLRKAQHTEIGQHYGFGSIPDYTEYQSRVPVHTYEQLKPYFDRIKQGEKDVLWPGTTSRFAVSSGTTGDGKHLPIFDDRLSSDKRFLRLTTFHLLKNMPRLSLFLGKHISIPGSVETIAGNEQALQIGEISGLLARETPAVLRPFQLCPIDQLVSLSFDEKFELIVSKAIEADIRVITAVPSWILTLFQRVLETTGASTVSEIWPNLQLMICGGVKLQNYAPILDELFGYPTPSYVETYGASEGYFGYAFSDDGQRSLKLIVDNGLFYELVPFNKGDALDSDHDVQPVWAAETGVAYKLLVSSNAGLWRYPVNDIIEFESVDPPRIRVTGRVKDMLDDFGEALHLSEAEHALQQVCNQRSIRWVDFAIRPIPGTAEHPPFHHWYIEWDDPAMEPEITTDLDNLLMQRNRHYEIRRSSGALGTPVIESLTHQQMVQKVGSQNELTSQTKIPGILR